MTKIKNIQVNAGQTFIKIPVSESNVKQKQAAAGNRSILPVNRIELNWFPGSSVKTTYFWTCIFPGTQAP